jgi:hypothetical protein
MRKSPAQVETLMYESVPPLNPLGRETNWKRRRNEPWGNGFGTAKRITRMLSHGAIRLPDVPVIGNGLTLKPMTLTRSSKPSMLLIVTPLIWDGAVAPAVVLV